jgi:hypothetical protein
VPSPRPGSTYALDAARAAWGGAGQRVMGLALSARPPRSFGDVSGRAQQLTDGADAAARYVEARDGLVLVERAA